MKINGGLIKAYSQMGQKGAASGIGMLEVVKRNPDVVAVVADSVAIASLDRFQKLYPDKIVNVGIAEQNMIGIAAGLASESGKSVYAFTYSAFIIARALEQVRLNLAYHQFYVKLVGNSAGFAMEMLGVSHWAVEDIAFTRVLPNMTVLSAADSLQAIKMVIAADEIDTPVYIRLSGGQNIPVVYEQDFEYRIGKAIKLKEGKDIAIIATGLMVHESLLAAELLEKRGIHCSVIDMHTIKPLDEEILDNVFSTFELIVTVEEHNVIGGLGSAVAEYKGSRKNAPRQVFIGVKDQYLKLGTQRYIWQQYGLTAEQIANKIISEI